MKKIFAALVLAGFASVASAAISGSPHDLSATLGVSSCFACHAAHNSNTAVTGAPIWNRVDASASGAFTPYTSGTLTPQVVAIGGNSNTCLSCHDGTTQLGAMFNGPVASAAITNAWTNIGKLLTNDHPVGIAYPVAGGGDAGLETAANINALVGSVKIYSYDGGTTYRVECGSCHDPHNTDWTAPSAASGPSFLRVSKATICAVCHVSK